MKERRQSYGELCDSQTDVDVPQFHEAQLVSVQVGSLLHLTNNFY